MSETLYIKDMVCVRCKMAVQAVLEATGIAYEAVELGWARLAAPLTAEQKKAVIAGLSHYHLELMEDRTAILVERIKTEIAAALQASEKLRLKLSAHLSGALGYNYTYLANVFSAEEGLTLEKYYITQRIELAKQLMVYEERSLTQITEDLHFSSVSHFCLQFKKVAGMTPAEFKKRYASGDAIWRSLVAANKK